MLIYRRAAALLIVSALLLAACAEPASQATIASGAPTAATPADPPSAPPTSAPPASIPPTAVPPLAQRVLIAGVDVGGMDAGAARAKLDSALAPLLRPLDLQAGDARLTIKAEDIGLLLPLDDMLAAAQSAQAGERVPLQLSYDEARLRALLGDLASQAATPPSITVISDTEEISRSFALRGGERLDIDAAARQIDDRLRALGGSRRVTLSLAQDGDARPSAGELQQQIEAMADEWNGIVGVYVYDLKQDRAIARLHENTVFSGASVMKAPILLESYINLSSFTPAQEQALQKMIVNSDNLAANIMLAASAGGSGTEDALLGALDMSDMLKELGLQHTYQYMPYEASQYLIKVRNIHIKTGPAHEGEAPFTEPDPVLRTTPAEISRIFLLINQCSQGRGLLLEKYPKQLTPARCSEMLDRLADNGDHTRMIAGLPDGVRVEHKSGWIEDMQADVGIVRSPGGDFLTAIYLYRKITPGKTYLSDEVAAPVIASFARLIYTYFNPLHP